MEGLALDRDTESLYRLLRWQSLSELIKLVL